MSRPIIRLTGSTTGTLTITSDIINTLSGTTTYHQQTVSIAGNLTVNSDFQFLVESSDTVNLEGNNNTVTVYGYTHGLVSLSSDSCCTLNIQNLNVGHDITSSDQLLSNAGWVLASMEHASSDIVTIRNCHSTGEIQGSDSPFGGIVGSYGGQYGEINVISCSSTGDICNYGSGGIVGSNFAYNGIGRIYDCHSSGTMKETNGGIVGQQCGRHADEPIGSSTIFIVNCYSTGDMNDTDSGGITGRYCPDSSDTVLYISNCYSTGDLNDNGIGGICGGEACKRGTLFVDKCYATGDINDDACGGIIGSSSFNAVNQKKLGYITNCYYSGNINVPIGSKDKSGGITGDVISGSSEHPDTRIVVANCYSSSQLNQRSSGGILGADNKNVEVINCYSTGNMARKWSGGIAGDDTESSLFYGCYSTGSAVSDAYECGGLVGNTDSNIKARFYGCYSAGEFLNSSDNGGLVGYAQSNSISHVENCFSNNQGQPDFTLSETYVDGSSDSTLLTTTLSQYYGYLPLASGETYPRLKCFTQDPWTGYEAYDSHPTLVSDAVDFDQLAALDIKTLHSNLTSICQGIVSDTANNIINITNMSNQLASTDSTGTWKFQIINLTSDNSTALNLDDISLSDQAQLATTIEDHLNTKLETDRYQVELSSGSVLANFTGASAGQIGGDPYVCPLFGTKIRLPNNWRYCLLYKNRETGTRLVARCKHLDEGYITKLHKLEKGKERPITAKDTYVQKWTYFDRIYLFEDQTLVAALNSLSGEVSQTVNHIESSNDRRGLYSLTHERRYPAKNLQTFKIKLSDTEYVVIKVDNYWDDINHIKFSTSQKQTIRNYATGELIEHKKQNRLAHL